MNKNEKKILLYLKENSTSKYCFKATDLEDLFIDKDKDEILEILLILESQEFLKLMTYHGGSYMPLANCYKISSKGLDELNPKSSNKKIYQLAIIGTLAAIVAAIASIISIFI